MLVHIHLLYAPKFSFAMPLPTTLRRFLMKSFNVSHVTVSLIDRNVLQHSMTGPDVGGLQHFHALQFHVRTFGMSPNVSQAIWGIFFKSAGILNFAPTLGASTSSNNILFRSPRSSEDGIWAIPKQVTGLPFTSRNQGIRVV